MRTDAPTDGQEKEWHALVHEYTCDVTGGSEVRDVAVRYVGRGAWRLAIHRSDFTSNRDIPSVIERMSTRRIIWWAIGEDGERDGYHYDDDDHPILGDTASRLLEIADHVGAEYCARCLSRYMRDEWPPPPRPPKILNVVGVEQKGIWIRKYKYVFVVDTARGVYHLSLPDRAGYAVLEGSSSVISRAAWRVRLRPEIREQVRSWLPQYKSLLRKHGEDAKAELIAEGEE